MEPVPSPDDAVEGFDAAVVGGGVVGCAIARRLTLAGLRVVLIEKAADILDGASKANSAILHTGFDAPPGSLEARLIAEGHAEYLEIRERLGLPLLRSGALVIAWTADEEARLPALIDQARANGVTDVELLTAAATRRLEPNLGPALRAAFRVPREHLIDPWSAPLAYLLQALENGGRLLRGAEVTGGAFDGERWRLETTRGPVAAGIAINAAGLYGDVVDQRLTGGRHFTIRPRKGQFIVFDKPAAALAGHILLPVPGTLTKGIVVCRTAYGNLLVGPTAEDQEDRVNAVLVPETLAALRQRGEAILPALRRHEVTAIYAGLRPATEFKDYQIRAESARNYVTAGGIRSTGLSAALGIARHVEGLVAALGTQRAPLEDPAWPRVPNLAEDQPRDWCHPGHGGIVCHCELVTRREIEAALAGPVPAGSVGGLKRRTRATLGRCQGFYCTAELAAMTAGRFETPMAEAAADGG
jgi:glycerol-3-phosphate dehydrogenase